MTVCSWNPSAIMIWSWRLWCAYALATRTHVRFGHGGSGDPMLSEPERNYDLVMDALLRVCSWNTNRVRWPS